MQAIRRKTQAFKEILGQSQKHEDYEYDHLYKQFQQVLDSNLTIRKNVDLFMKQAQAMITTINLLAISFSDIHIQAGVNFQLPLKLRSLVVQLEMMLKSLENNIESQVKQPMAEYQEKSIPILQLQTKRKNHRLDMEFYRDAVESSQWKDPVTISTRKEKLRVAKEQFDDCDCITKASMMKYKIKQYEVFSTVGEQLFGAIRASTELFMHSLTSVTEAHCGNYAASPALNHSTTVRSSPLQLLPEFTMDGERKSLDKPEVFELFHLEDLETAIPSPVAAPPSEATYQSTPIPREISPFIEKKRILIITSNEGGGHAAATRAIQRSLPQDQYEIHTVLPTEEIPCSSMYNTLMKKGQYRALGVMVRLQGTAETFVMDRPSKLVAQEMDRIKPQLIISVIPVMNKIVMNLATERNIPMMVVPTDLTFDHFFCHITSVPSTFRVALPFNDVLDKRVLMKSRGFKEENFVVTGYPLRPEFGYSFDKLADQYSSIQRELGIGAGDKVMVIMMGAQGSKQQTLHYISQIVKDTWKVCSSEFNIHIVALCGENEQLRRLISYITTVESIKLHALPKRDGAYIASLLKFADIFITKPGGSSVNESLALGVYTLYDDASTVGLWWEGENMRYAISHKGGEVIRDFSQQVRTILRKDKPKPTMDECPGRYFDRNILKLVEQMTRSQ